jgi:hypothetical protein
LKEGFLMHNTHMSKFIPPQSIVKTAGTWTPSVAANLPIDVRTAAGAAFTLIIPIPLDMNSTYRAGARLKSIDVWYKILTADATDFATVELEKITLTATGSKPTAAALTGVTIDALHDTAAERKAAGEHTMTVTLNTPEWLDDDEAYALTCVVDAAAGTVFTLYGARANFELRLE